PQYPPTNRRKSLNTHQPKKFLNFLLASLSEISRQRILPINLKIIKRAKASTTVLTSIIFLPPSHKAIEVFFCQVFRKSRAWEEKKHDIQLSQRIQLLNPL
ncbi:hypothetical protein CISIN_1g044221mg, partial [Citrus sinensis]